MAKVAVIYYSATGNVHAMARAVEEGAASAGAEVRRRHVAELAPEEAIAQNQAWAAHRDEVRDDPLAALDDLEWCDAYILGSPTRFGNVSSQLKQFMDTAGGLWAQGKLADKVAAGFTSSQNAHGGQESTLLALYNTFHHWGAIIAAPGYTSPRAFPAGGNPYGASCVNGPTEDELDWARYTGERVAGIAARLAG
jgi:NAD(P)H dehydrogenase (quinone)